MTDISAIVTAHSESVLAGPTMRSAEAAIAAAEAAGFSVERLIGLDTPTAPCRAYFESSAFDGWRRLSFAFRDQGLARNALAEAASGRWIAFLDADDLWSENWLAEAARRLQRAETEGLRAIAHPELNWVYGGNANVMVKIEQDEAPFHPYIMYFKNYYDALAMAPREAHIEHPYAMRDLPQGFAFEDMQWNIETMAAGWRHVVAPDTIVFKQRRAASQTVQAGARGVTIRDLDVMRIENVLRLGRT